MSDMKGRDGPRRRGRAAGPGALFHPSAAARRALRRGSMSRLETNACGGAEVVSHSNRFLLLLIAPDYLCIECVYVEGPEPGRVRRQIEIVKSG